MGVYVWGTGCGASELMERAFSREDITHGHALNKPRRGPLGLGNEQRTMEDSPRGGSRNQSTPGSAAASKRQKQ